jgi:PAS domain S-box-containing protein
MSASKQLPWDVDLVPFQGIVEQSLAGFYIIQDEVFQYCNATFAHMAGYEPEEMVGKPLRDCVPPDFVEEVMDRYRRRISGEVKSMRFITHGLHRNGETVYIEVQGSHMEYRGRPAVVGVGINVTEQVLRADELRQSREQYRQLVSYLTTVREEQRRHHARELHDVLGGILTSMKLNVSRLTRHSRNATVNEIADDLNLLVNEAIGNVREIAEALRPQTLDHLGLKAAMASHLDSFRKRSAIRVEFESTEIELDLPAQRAIGVFRIFQEAITNVARHSAATAVTVRLLQDGERLRLEVADDGCGMDVQRQLVPTTEHHVLGLLTMRERAKELGGCMRIDSQPGAGTRLVLDLPLHEPLGPAPPDEGPAP